MSIPDTVTQLRTQLSHGYTVTVQPGYPTDSICPIGSDWDHNDNQDYIYVFPHLEQPEKGSKVQGDVIDNVPNWEQCGEFLAP